MTGPTPPMRWWHGTKREVDRSRPGATLRFAYLSTRRATSASGQCSPTASVGFDELTSWPNDRLYRMMFRVLRLGERQLPGVPVRMRSAVNPGDVGHGWCKHRFAEEATREPGRPVRAGDDPRQPVLRLRPVPRSPWRTWRPSTGARLINGDWDVEEEGARSDRAKFRIVKLAASSHCRVKVVRYWDLAATEPDAPNPDPTGWSASALEPDARASPPSVATRSSAASWKEAEVEAPMLEAAPADGIYVPIKIEQEPGTRPAKNLIAHYAARHASRAST